MSYRTHGLKYQSLNPLTVRPEYAVWASMKGRCLNPNSQNYKNYGGRGIFVCDRWLKFEGFYADMGSRPSPLHSVGRIDNNGNYEPSNCRWETNDQQNNNKRQNTFYTYGGETKTLKQWADYAGLTIGTLWHRLKTSKMPFEEAISKKSRFEHSKKVNVTEAEILLSSGKSVAFVAKHFKVTNKVIRPIRERLGIKPHKNQFTIELGLAVSA